MHQGPAWGTTPPRTRKPLPQWRFVVWWVALLTLHTVCLSYFIGVSIVYRRLLPKSTLAFQFRTYSIGIAESEYPKIATFHEIVAIIHALNLLLMLGGSLQAKRFVFYPSRPHVQQDFNWRWCGRRHRISPLQIPMMPRASSLVTRLSHTFSTVVVCVSRMLCGRRGIFGIEFPLFDHVLLTRELLETSLQTYQAYRMTHCLPRLWLIRLYVTLLVFNCWLVPVLHLIYKKRHRLRRLMILVSDVVLDLTSSMGISFIIFVSYAQQYNDAHNGFTFDLFYHDEWFTTLYQEFQIMIVVSWGDMVSRLVFAFGVLQGMDSIKDLLIDAFQKKLKAMVAVAPRIVTSPQPANLKRDHRIESRLQRGVDFVLHVLGPTCFVICGITILAIHIYTEVHYADVPCKLPLRPWFSTKPACALVEIDCRQLDTYASLDQDYWKTFDPALAAGLVIRHCPEFTITSSLHSFSGLITMKTYNTTITSWPETAGISTTTHDRLRALYFIRTNMTNGALPAGLTRRDFPPTFRTFFASATNLVSFPVNLHTVWPQEMLISIEFATFTSIPDVILRLNPSVVSFAHTPITSLPAAWFELPALSNLLLSYTAIQELPHNVTNLGMNLYSLGLEGTNISFFWSWMDPFIVRSMTYPMAFMAADTPFCREQAEIVNGTRTQFSVSTGETDLSIVMDTSTPNRFAYSLRAVTCSSQFPMLFPLFVEDERS